LKRKGIRDQNGKNNRIETENVVWLSRHLISFMMVTSAGMQKSCLFEKKKKNHIN